MFNAAKRKETDVLNALAPRRQVTLLLGAGFSRWSCNLPLVSELFDFAVTPDNEKEERRFQRLATIYNEWRSTHPHAHVEAFITYWQTRGDRFNLVNWYITRRLTNPFIVSSSRRYTWYINSYHPWRHDGIRRARSLVDALAHAGDVSVGTTNYDMVVEYAVSSRGFNYGIVGEQIGFTPYPHIMPVYAKGELSIAKLHGSISWDTTRKFPDMRCGLTGDCLIIPPVSGKIPNMQLRDQWRFAGRAIRKSDVLVVFGFSFNDYDKAVRQLFSRNLREAAHVIFVDVFDHRPRLRTLFGRRRTKFVDAKDPSLIEVLTSTLRAVSS